MRRDRLMGALFVVLGIAVASAIIALTVVMPLVSRLQRDVAAERAAGSKRQQLIQALQRQVRDCQQHRGRCGPPLTALPTPQSRPGTSAPPTVTVVVTPAPTPQRSRPSTPKPSPTPRSPSPSPSPSSHPSPSPSLCVLKVKCLAIPGGG